MSFSGFVKPKPDGDKKPIGNAVVGNVLSGKTFSTPSGINQTGTMPNQGSPTFTPTGSPQSIPAGYYAGGSVGAVAPKTISSSSGIGTSTLTINFNQAVNYFLFTWHGIAAGGFMLNDIAFYSSSDAVLYYYYQGDKTISVSLSGLGTPTVTLTIPGGNWSNLPTNYLAI